MAKQPWLAKDRDVAAAGKQAVDGWQLGNVDAGRLVREAVRSAYQHDAPGLAAEIAYNGALTLLPFLLLVASLPVVLEDVFAIPELPAHVAGQADRFFTAALAAIVGSVLDEVSRSRGTTAFFAGLLGTIWSGMSTMSSIRKALNRIYGFDDRTPYLLRKLYQAALAAVTAALALAAFLALLIGPNLIEPLLGPLTRPTLVVGAAALILGAVALVYWLAPAAENSFRWITPGALLFAITWLIFSLGFSVYVSAFSAVNRFYGSLGVMIIILVWLYGSSFALLLGAAVNAEAGRRFDPEVEAPQHESRIPSPPK